MRIFPVIIGMLLAVPAFAQSPGTVSLIGPSTTPGAPQVTRVAQINEAVNAALVVKVDTMNGTLTNPTIGGNATINTTSATGYQQNGNTILNTFRSNTIAGVGAGASLPTNDDETTAFGYFACNALIQAVSENTCIGWSSQRNITTGTFNTSLGVNTIGADTTGSSLVALGTDAMRDSIGSLRSIGIGVAALRDNVQTDSIFIGTQAGAALAAGAAAIGHDNICIGSQCMNNNALTTAASNVNIGTAAMQAATTGYNNVFIGASTGTLATTARQNVVIGSGAGAALTTGPVNTFIGAGACANVTTANTDICIGYNTAVPSATASNQVSIANLVYMTNASGQAATVSPGQVGIGAKAPNATLTVGDPASGYGPHIGILATAPPAISGCVGCSLDATASDTAGTLTEGTAQTGFVLTFEVTFLSNPPHCVVSSPTGTALTSYTTTQTTLTVVHGSTTGAKFSYVCFQ